ncbi:hypothetical protein [Streptomyces abikoensis]|uniref:hypothetical protein n=1 Tax=Streptomyces abikoensis TaxID=97398 RepID=UPI001678A249|nr:hypothetical protein [Streptomyces abikoensis]GGP55894.1 hypothetical protein GCM10010214_31360 [Streptomyces abikoensis]
MNTALSLGGVALALAILYLNMRPWWKGGRDFKAILPYGSGSVLGSLATVCIGGLLGWGAAGNASLLSGSGDKAVHSVTGTGSAPVAHASAGALTSAGGVVVFLLFVGVGALFRGSGKKDRWRIIGGFISWSALGFLPGVAAVLAHLVFGVNWIGDKGWSMLNNGAGLL